MRGIRCTVRVDDDDFTIIVHHRNCYDRVRGNRIGFAPPCIPTNEKESTLIIITNNNNKTVWISKKKMKRYVPGSPGKECNSHERLVTRTHTGSVALSKNSCSSAISPHGGARVD